MILISTSFISLESPSKTSKLLLSSCSSNAEQSLVSSSRTADGIIQFFRDVKLRHCVYQVMSTSCLIWNQCFRNNLWCGSWFFYRFSCNFIVQCFKARRRILINRSWNDININWQKYTSHLCMSDVAYQLVKRQSGAIPMLTLVTPVTWCIQTKSGVLSSFKIWKPVSPANKKQKIRPILKSTSWRF